MAVMYDDLRHAVAFSFSGQADYVAPESAWSGYGLKSSPVKTPSKKTKEKQAVAYELPPPVRVEAKK